MNIKSLLATIFMFASISVLSFAQTRTVEHEFSEFKVSDALESYIQCYVKAGTLYIGIDEKSVPKEVKKSFKGKNSDGPVLEATVYVPVLNSVTLNDNSTFSSDGSLSSNDFKLSLSGTSSITNLNVSANSASLSVSKKSKLSSINVKVVDKVTVNAEGSASVVLEFSAKTLEVNNSGSADLAINGQCETTSVCTAGSAKLSLAGKASILNVSGTGGSSKIDAVTMSVDDVNVSLDGASLTVTPAKNLSLDLGKGASVCYSGDPLVKIVKIQNATVTRQ